jgi:hypothetical protein
MGLREMKRQVLKGLKSRSAAILAAVVGASCRQLSMTSKKSLKALKTTNVIATGVKRSETPGTMADLSIT